MEAFFRTTTKILSTLLVSVVVLLAICLAGVRLIGLTPYTVLSGSMEPAYHVGSIIYVMDIEPTELKVGDPVTFRLSGNTIATHRIIEVFNEGTSQLSFRTKGDANQIADGEIPASAVIGKPVFTIPYLGYISNFIQKPQGIICVVGTGTAVLLISYAIDALFTKEKESASEPDAEDETV
jgi:signal peptidase